MCRKRCKECNVENKFPERITLVWSAACESGWWKIIWRCSSGEMREMASKVVDTPAEDCMISKDMLRCVSV